VAWLKVRRRELIPDSDYSNADQRGDAAIVARIREACKLAGLAAQHLRLHGTRRLEATNKSIERIFKINFNYQLLAPTLALRDRL
jgi:hypothetical protein